MPSTINGIGTTYYGKKNLSVRTGACEFCRRVVTLSSYDTRLWFVIFFVPVIPLGRKRIFDQCPSCSKHRVMSARQYAELRQRRISESVDRFEQGPSPQTALDAHATILAFRDHERAAQLRRDALAQFPKDVGMMTGMASHLEEVSAPQEAAKLYETALDLDPSVPVARAGVAMKRMSEGRLEEARSLLDFLELSGAGREHSLTPLYMLAMEYQKQGRHAEALALRGICYARIRHSDSNMGSGPSSASPRRPPAAADRSCRPANTPCGDSWAAAAAATRPGNAASCFGAGVPQLCWAVWLSPTNTYAGIARSMSSTPAASR